MTGWTQFTVRFEEERHADGLKEDVDIGETEGALHASYNETLGDIARVRLVGYDMEEDALRLLQEAGPIEAALVAHFNDTTDSGYVDVFLPERRSGLDEPVARAESAEAARWSFHFESFGLTETGTRAGNDFTLEQEYGDDDRKVVPLDEIETIADKTVELLKDEARVVSEEHRNA